MPCQTTGRIIRIKDHVPAQTRLASTAYGARRDVSTLSESRQLLSILYALLLGSYQ